MKKSLITASVILTFFTLDAKILPEQYYKFMSNVQTKSNDFVSILPKFSAHTDLIRGSILIDSDILKNYRFYGWGQFLKSPDLQANQNPADNCSYLDSSTDPVMDLIIQLFPSTGTELSAEGAGSFSDMISRLINSSASNRDDLINQKIASIIGDFFNIAHSIRTMKNPLCMKFS